MAITKVLIKIAKKSPKEYAAKILKRNEELLKLLEELKSEYDENMEEGVPVYSNTHRIEKGCPHCNISYICKGCIWSENRSDKTSPHSSCCAVKFNGVNYNDVEHGYRTNVLGFSIGYAYCWASVEFDDNCVTDFSEADQEKIQTTYEKCKKFLEGHIEWAKLDCWGEEFEC